MAWTAPRTFVAGEVETAAIFNTHLRDNLLAINAYVEKTADESVVSSIVQQNDDHLFYAIPGTGTFIVDVWILALSAISAAGDISLALTFPAGTAYWMGFGPDATIASGTVSTGRWAAFSTYASGTAIDYGLSAAVMGIHLHLLYKATASGTLRLTWAQMASSVSASTVKAGSHMTVKQVA